MEKEAVLTMINFLPKYADIEDLLKEEAEAAYIIKLAIENMENIRTQENQILETQTEEAFYLMECLIDKIWERIHTGHFSEVPLKTRKIYAIANYFKIFYLMLEDCISMSQIEKCSALLDDAMLVGCTRELYAQHEQLQQALMEYFDKNLEKRINTGLPILQIQSRRPTKSDVLVLDCPSILEFSKCCFDPQTPALLLNTFTHWPAVEKWLDLNYINKVAGNRCVPIEIGSNYTTDEWSQQIVKLRDFLQRQFGSKPSNATEIEYLAQHELFEQIPALKADIRTPDYCTLGKQIVDADIKAWLGPKGTISPMHYDPKHNLLCQIFGIKSIILAAPTDTPYLYAHETEFLSNTSQIDAANIDIKKFPLASKVKFYYLTLQAGDCLYIPPKWWHYVCAESPSFSVSFWWD